MRAFVLLCFCAFVTRRPHSTQVVAVPLVDTVHRHTR